MVAIGDPTSMLERFIANWVYGASLFALFLLALAPLLLHGFPPAVAAVFFTLPAYMLHQWEEHDNDRFRLFVNHWIGNDRQALSRLDVFLINVPGVWGVITLSLWLAATINSGYGYVAIYLVLVNAVVHILQAILMRRYNPGTITAVILFLPVGGYAWFLLNRADASVVYNSLGLAIAIAIHLAIMLRVRLNLTARLTSQPIESAVPDRNREPL